MWDLFQLAINPVVLPFTVLLILAMAYWLLLIFGVVGLELFDIDLDLDVDGDAGADAGAAGGGNLAVSTLHYFHVGEVPIMIILTAFAVSMWVTTLITTFYVQDPEISSWVPVLLLGPNLLVSLIVVRFALLPLRSFFRSLNDTHASRVKIVGQICLITTSEVTERFGQAEIAQDGPPIVIDVICRKGDQLRKGDAGKVESYNKENRTYVVVPYTREG